MEAVPYMTPYDGNIQRLSVSITTNIVVQHHIRDINTIQPRDRASPKGFPPATVLQSHHSPFRPGNHLTCSPISVSLSFQKCYRDF